LSENKLLGTAYADQFIYSGVRDHFSDLKVFIERMLRADDSDIREAGARLASVASLFHQGADHLVKEAMDGDQYQRLGVAKVATANICNPKFREWCEEILLVLFNDSAPEVCREAASCFRQFGEVNLEDYDALISVFCDSSAFNEDSYSILSLLNESVNQLPGITILICGKFISRFGTEAKDIQKGKASDIRTVVSLIFRTYHQHQNDDWAPKCLDLIDQLCLSGIRDVNKGFENYER